MDRIPVRVASNGESSVNEGPANGRKGGRGRRGRRLVKWLAILILLIALVVAGTWFFGRGANLSGQIDGGKYQALFLTNGQVYFGKLKTIGTTDYVLTDIFYLQTDATSTDSKNPQATASQSDDNVKLIKLGSEVHGPEDKMVVNRQQVLFFENLKSDGRVSASIDQYLKKK